jgi:hypothetical protein
VEAPVGGVLFDRGDVCPLALSAAAAVGGMIVEEPVYGVWA